MKLDPCNMEESSLRSNGQQYITESSISNDHFAAESKDTYVSKQFEIEQQNSLSSYSNLPTKQFDNDDIFGIKPPPYEQNSPSVASYGTATPMTSKQRRTYKFDVLLMYDDKVDHIFAEELLELLEPRELKICDFAKEQTPGVTKQKFFADALKECKYTCIVVTSNFINTFWLKLKADMAIQDMFDNEHKQYTLVVVVMDMALTEKDLPLELTTLSPIFRRERYFRERLSKAFGASCLFMEQGLKNQRPSTTSSLEAGSSFLDHQFTKDPTKFQNSIESYHPPKKFIETGPESFTTLLEKSSYLMSQESSSSDSETVMSGKHKPMPSNLLSHQSYSSDSAISGRPSRTPKEHAESSHIKSSQKNMSRLTSVTRSSTGLRQPAESDESISPVIIRPPQAHCHASNPTSFPPIVTGTSLLSAVPETTTTMLSVDAIHSRETPPLPNAEHFSFEERDANVVRVPPEGGGTPGPSNVVEEASAAQDSDDSMEKVNLEISTDEIPAAFLRPDPEPQSDSVRESVDESERSTSLHSIRMAYNTVSVAFKRWRGKLK